MLGVDEVLEDALRLRVRAEAADVVVDHAGGGHVGHELGGDGVLVVLVVGARVGGDGQAGLGPFHGRGGGGGGSGGDGDGWCWGGLHDRACFSDDEECDVADGHGLDGDVCP